MRRSLSALLVVAWLVAGCGSSSNGPGGGSGGGGGGGGGADLPAASVVIFGTAFDPTALTVSGKATSMKAGTPIVAVGRAFTARPASEVTVTVGSGSNNKPARPVTASNNPDSADLFATDLSVDQLPPGTWVVSFVAKGRTIASGFLTVTP